MTNIILTDELRRFIHAIESIPHLEAMLLMRQGGELLWNEKTISERLYVSSEVAANMLVDLSTAGICVPSAEGDGFVYGPASELDALVYQLAMYYSHHLIEVTNMIHTKSDTNRRARLFADAFVFKKEE